MMRMHHKAVLGGLALAGLVVLAPATVLAEGPEKSSFSSEYTNAWLWDAAGNVVTCAGEPVTIDGVSYGTITTWLDPDGNIVRVKLYGRAEESWYLASNPDRRLRAKATYSTFTLTPGVGLYQGLEKWTGLFWHVVAPGYGTVLLDAGLEIIDWTAAAPVVKVAGRHQWIDGDFGKLCAALTD